ncbi:MAG: hypothetical protein WC595_01225 [Candidatus Nanoarchaeia archaeon]
MGKRLRNFWAAVGIGVGSLGASSPASAKEPTAIVKQFKELNVDQKKAVKIIHHESIRFHFNSDLRNLLKEIEAEMETYWSFKGGSMYLGDKYNKAQNARMKETEVSLSKDLKKARGYGDDELRTNLNFVESVFKRMQKAN